MQKFYADVDGKYLGSFDGGEPPVGAIEVPSAPERAYDIYASGKWLKVSTPQTINQQRDDALGAGFTHNGLLYHCDSTFQSQIQAFLLAWQVGMLAPTATVSIRRHDNVTVQMTQAEVGALAGALMAYVQGVYAASWAAKDALG